MTHTAHAKFPTTPATTAPDADFLRVVENVMHQAPEKLAAYNRGSDKTEARLHPGNRKHYAETVRGWGNLSEG